MSRHFRMFRGNSSLITSFKLENGNVEFRSGAPIDDDVNKNNFKCVALAAIRSFE